MRKTMTKEITFTSFNVAKMVVENGTPLAKEQPTERMIGNISEEKAQKEMTRKYLPHTVMVYNIETETVVYEMDVEEFIKHATIKEGDLDG